MGSAEEGCSPPAARAAAVKEARGMAALDLVVEACCSRLAVQAGLAAMAAKVEAQEEARARSEAESCSHQVARAEEAAASWAWATVVAMEARGREAAGWAGAGCIRLVERAVEAMLAEAARGTAVDGSHLGAKAAAAR